MFSKSPFLDISVIYNEVKSIFPKFNRASVAEWLGYRSHTTKPLASSPHRFAPRSYDATVWESLSVYLWKVGGLSPNTLYNVSGFSFPPIKTDRHHVTEKLLSMAKNYKQTNPKFNTFWTKIQALRMKVTIYNNNISNILFLIFLGM